MECGAESEDNHVAIESGRDYIPNIQAKN